MTDRAEMVEMRVGMSVYWATVTDSPGLWTVAWTQHDRRLRVTGKSRAEAFSAARCEARRCDDGVAR